MVHKHSHGHVSHTEELSGSMERTALGREGGRGVREGRERGEGGREGRGGEGRGGEGREREPEGGRGDQCKEAVV